MRVPYMKVITIGLLAGMTFAAACSSKKVSQSNPGVAAGTNESGTGTGDGTAESPAGGDTAVNPKDKVAALSASVGLLNFRQVSATFQSQTGVTLSNAAVLAEYNRQQTSLPNDAAPAAISASKVSAATKLAAQYCDVLATTPALLTARFPGLTVNAVPANSAAFAKTLVDGFYGAEHTLQGARETDIASVSATVDALKALNGATGPAIFMATCAAVLASAEFYLY